MVYVIKQVIEGNPEAHRFFTRFGKGKFEDRFGIEFGKKIKGTFDNVFSILIFLSSLAELEVKGVILAKKEIDMEIEKLGMKIEKKKKKRLLYEYKVEGKLKKDDLKKLTNVYYFLLDANGEGISFKCKKKLPKPGKDLKKDFFVLSLSKDFLEKFKKEFLFDFSEDAKKIEISHDIIVEKIILPKNEKDYEKLREESLRQGKIIRKIKFDGKEIKKEYKFLI